MVDVWLVAFVLHVKGRSTHLVHVNQIEQQEPQACLFQMPIRQLRWVATRNEVILDGLYRKATRTRLTNHGVQAIDDFICALRVPAKKLGPCSNTPASALDCVRWVLGLKYR